MVTMSIDALTVNLRLPSTKRIGDATAQFYQALEEIGARVDPISHVCTVSAGATCPRCVPPHISAAATTAKTRDEHPRLLDRLLPGQRDRNWRPVAEWLQKHGDLLERAPGSWADAVGQVSGGVVARSREGIDFIFALTTRDGPTVLLLFDWLTFNRCPDGPEAVSRIAATIASRVDSMSGAGGNPETWRPALGSPQQTGALVSISHGSVTGFDQHIARVGQVVAAWTAVSDEITGVTEGRVGADETDLFAFEPQWTGCSGRFLQRPDGDDEARVHYLKHVHDQREWSPEEMPDVATYVKYATDALDSVENTFEMWQPSNVAVIKYDPGRDVLAIGTLHQGDLLTCFRPGGADYALRKLRTGQWVPPPIRGAVAYAPSRDDDVLQGLVAEYERAVAGFEVEASAAAAGEERRLLGALAGHERAAFLEWRVRSQFLTPKDEARLDAIALAYAKAGALLDVTIELCGTEGLMATVAAAVERYVSSGPDILATSSVEDELDDLLGLRDKIEFARMACRGRGPLAGVFPPRLFRDAELLAVDAMALLTPRHHFNAAPAGGWPETFVWRLGD
jgi:hypothetical protein